MTDTTDLTVWDHVGAVRADEIVQIGPREQVAAADTAGPRPRLPPNANANANANANGMAWRLRCGRLVQVVDQLAHEQPQVGDYYVLFPSGEERLIRGEAFHRRYRPTKLV